VYRILTQCRACGGSLKQVIALGHTPLANALAPTRSEAMSLPRYPLNLCVCERCEFVQLDVAIDSKVLFEHYLYVTPSAKSLDAHYDALLRTVDSMVDVMPSLRELPATRVVEMGSNNGAFLRAISHHVESVVGIEPAKNIADMANATGIETIPEFFTELSVDYLKRRVGRCDLFVARHCMAHLDDLPGTLRAIARMLDDNGIAVIENAYLRRTLHGAQFDQIYHEHMSYFALRSFKRLAEACGLSVHHAEVASVHGGSIVMIASKKGAPTTSTFDEIWNEEEFLQDELESFAFETRSVIGGLREAMLHLMQTRGSRIYTYGATAKGNTLLNSLGFTHRNIPYAVDSTSIKQGRFLPGSGIEVVSEEWAAGRPPDAYLLTAWNWADEILAKQSAYRSNGGRFIIPLPMPRLQ